MSKEETVEVTIKLPKAIADFLKDEEHDLAEYVTQTIIESVLSEIEGVTPKIIMDRYKLAPVFEAYGVLPDYYKDREAEKK